MKDKLYNFFKFISEYALYSLLFFIPISISLIEVFAAFVFVGFVGRKIIKPDFRFLRFWPNALLLLFLFFSALSLLNSGTYLNKSLHALFAKWMQYMGICIIIQDIARDRKVVKNGMFVFLFGALIAVSSGLSQYFFGNEFLRNKGATVMNNGWHAMTASFAHYNSFGAYLVVVLALTGALLLAGNCYSLKTFTLLIFSMFSTAAIMLTFSRGSWIALFISFILMLITVRKNFVWLIPIFFMIVAIGLLPEIRERLYSTFKAGGDTDRLRYWSVTLKMIKVHPFFGIGIGTFMANFPKYNLREVFVSYAHNCYLQIWAETGIFSLISFIAFVVSVVYVGIKGFFVSKDFLLLGLVFGAVGLLIHSFLDTDLYSLQLSFLFWIWVGLIISRLRIAH